MRRGMAAAAGAPAAAARGWMSADAGAYGGAGMHVVPAFGAPYGAPLGGSMVDRQTEHLNRAKEFILKAQV